MRTQDDCLLACLLVRWLHARKVEQAFNKLLPPLRTAFQWGFASEQKKKKKVCCGSFVVVYFSFLVVVVVVIANPLWSRLCSCSWNQLKEVTDNKSFMPTARVYAVCACVSVRIRGSVPR